MDRVGEREWAYPLCASDRKHMFLEWCRLNQAPLASMEEEAVRIHSMGMRVSAKYLVEYQRYQSPEPSVGIPFADAYGKAHVYRINNSDTPFLARWLLERHPDMRIETRRSMVDGEVVCDG